MNKIFLFGDIHGSNEPIKDFVKRNRETENFDGSDIMILLGDAGLNYTLDTFDYIRKKILGKYPFTYFVIRGNHEERPSICAEKNPDAWTTEKFFGNTVYVEKEFPYIKYALDIPAVYEIPIENLNCKTIIFPGAYSVDKEYRLTVGHKWFPTEQMTQEEMEIGRKLIMEHEPNLVLSHTCPCSLQPFDLFLPFIDQKKVDKTMEKYLGEIEFVLRDTPWVWGHYHAFRSYPNKRLMLFHQAVELTQFLTEEVPLIL